MGKESRSVKIQGPSRWRRKALAAAISMACVTTVLIHDATHNIAHADSCPAANNTIAIVTNSACSLGDVTPTDTLTVNNAGAISVTNFGIAVGLTSSATGVTITNNGTISLSAPGTDSGSAAIQMHPLTIGTSIVNTGSITAFENFTTTAQIAGVRFVGKLDGTVTNNGSISAMATFANFAIATGVGSIDELTGTLTNSSTGTINASAENAAFVAVAMGVLVGSATTAAITGEDIAASGTLTNNGNISATASDATFVAIAGGVVLGDLAGDLTNGGSISATALNAGLAVAIGGFLVSSFTGGGAVTGGIIETGGMLNNSGSIAASASSATSAFAIGIGAARIDGGGDLVNSGNISATAHFAFGAAAAGVYLTDSTSIIAGGTFTNSSTGSISATASFASSARAGGVVLGDLAGDLTNDGSISATAHSASGVTAVGILLGTPGLVLRNDITLTGTLTNSSTGSISAFVSNASNGSAIGVRGGDLLGNFTNDGSIRATAQNMPSALAVQGVGFFDTVSGTLTNNGTIIAEATVPNIIGIAGLATNSVSGTGIVNNTGTIAATLVAATSNLVNVSGYGGLSFNGTLNNSGLISATLTGGTAASRSYALFFPAAGTGQVNNLTSGVLSAQAFFLGGIINLTNNGTITISQDSIVGGDYLQASGSTLNIIVNSTTNDDSGNIVAGGNMNISTSSTVFMNTGSVLNITSSTYQVLDAVTSTTNIETTPPVITGSALYSFAVDPTSDANTLIIGITPSLIIPALLANSPNANAVFTSGTFSNLLAGNPLVAQALGGISDPNLYIQALEGMTPDTSGLIPVSFNLQNLLFDTVINRITSLREVTYTNNKPLQGLAAGDPATVGGVGMWMQGYGSMADQNDRDGVFGYEADSNGVALGADALLTRKLRLGAVISYASADVDTNVIIRSLDIDSYQGALYASFQADQWFIDGAATYAYNDYDASRTVLGVTPTGEFSGDQWGGRLRIGKRINYQGVEYIPFLDFNYITLETERYTETGGGALNLTVSSENYDYMQSALGVSLSKLYEFGNGMTYRPEVHAAVIHQFSDDAVSNTAAFAVGGAAFTTVGLEQAENGLNLGGSLAIYSGDNLDVRAAYDYEHRAEYTSHAGQFIVRYLFY